MPFIFGGWTSVLSYNPFFFLHLVFSARGQIPSVLLHLLLLFIFLEATCYFIQGSDRQFESVFLVHFSEDFGFSAVFILNTGFCLSFYRSARWLGRKSLKQIFIFVSISKPEPAHKPLEPSPRFGWIGSSVTSIGSLQLYQVRVAERSKASESLRLLLSWLWVFWSLNVGVGSNPTSYTFF